jgi:hypothetical protein
LEIRFIIGDFANQGFPSTTLASRGRVAKTPPLIEKISYLALIKGETG